MPRDIVLDTNVLVAAFRSTRGASYQLVRSIGLADWRLNVSVALALEYEDVLKREGMLPGISRPEIDDFLDYVFRTSHLVRFVLRRRPSFAKPGRRAYPGGGGPISGHDRHPQSEGFCGCGTVWCRGQNPGRISKNVESRPMSVSVSVPEELYQKAVEIADAQRVSVDEVFASAFAEQLSAWQRLQQRAARGTREKFLAALDKVPDVEPDEHDQP